MRMLALLLLLGLLMYAQDSRPLKPPSPTSTIDGTVFSTESAPVAGIMVYAVSENSKQGLKFPVMTNEFGVFHLDNVKLGKAAIYAYSEELGYLNPSFGFNSGNRPSALVTVVPGGVTGVIARLGPPCAYLIGTVLSSEDRTPVSTAMFKLSRADDPNLWLSTAPADATGHFRLGVPSNSAFRLSIADEQFKLWQLGSEELALKPGQEYSIEVRLQPTSKNR